VRAGPRRDFIDDGRVARALPARRVDRKAREHAALLLESRGSTLSVCRRAYRLRLW